MPRFNPIRICRVDSNPQVSKPTATSTPLGIKKIESPMNHNHEKLNLALSHLNSLKHFIGPAQRTVLRENFRNDEKDYFFEKVRQLAELVVNMPETGETNGQGRQAVAQLHYFAGGQANWYITEKDKGSPDDEIKGVQHQAFGLGNLFGDGDELGYISIQEILDNGGELDLYFKPETLAEIYAKETAQQSGVVMWQEEPKTGVTELPAWRQHFRPRR